MTDMTVLLSASDAGRLADLADALEMLARLHDRELDAAFVDGLRTHAIADWFGKLLAGTDRHRDAAPAFAGALAVLPDPMTDTALTELAADFAAIYLTHSYRAAPNGSVWLTDDGLERQMPMFEVREWYDHYDISVPDWRKRADDHIVPELLFVAFLARRGDRVAAVDCARFLDQLVLSWAPDFLERIETRAATPFYRATARLSRAMLDALRETLEAATGEPRRFRAPPQIRANAPAEEDAPFMPGVAESW